MDGNIKIRAIDGGRGILQYGQGHIDGSQMLAENRRFFRDRMEAFTASRYWISDFAAVTSTDMTTDQLRELAILTIDVSKQKPGLWVGLCAPRDLLFGLSRMWEALAAETGWTSRVFKSREETRAALEAYLGEPAPDWWT